MKITINNLLTIGIILSLLMSGYSLFKVFEGEEVAIATDCSKWASGDAWVSHFCRPNEEGTDMICQIDREGDEPVYSLLSSIKASIDINQIKGCIERVDGATIRVNYINKKEVKK